MNILPVLLSLAAGLCQVKFLQHWWRRDDLTNQAARSATSLQV